MGKALRHTASRNKTFRLAASNSGEYMASGLGMYSPDPQCIGSNRCRQCRINMGDRDVLFEVVSPCHSPSIHPRLTETLPSNFLAMSTVMPMSLSTLGHVAPAILKQSGPLFNKITVRATWVAPPFCSSGQFYSEWSPWGSPSLNSRKARNEIASTVQTDLSAIFCNERSCR